MSAVEELRLLKAQVQDIARVCNAVAKGDLSQKITIQIKGEMSTLKGTVNFMLDQLSAFASEVTHVALEVGTQGILGGQARVEGEQGTWADLTRNVNKMASNLTNQVRSISEVTKAVALGDLSKVVNVDVQGEMLDLKMTVNSMVVQLSTLANEITRVSLEVGTEGILGVHHIGDRMCLTHAHCITLSSKTSTSLKSPTNSSCQYSPTFLYSINSVL
ncbi:putative two-component system sensor kinase [Suillus discolor]|uniref:Two-component system sensor kinase n=1 Tax=Suillus discolor TaxID=1912936 RepID=A0A9P7ET26_9AGAM|nr:putative two-component system sensor kinase [Suillus discolor]KAG2087618.1 putative two-component system sensor kinase [Suillus discolor]